MKYLILPIIIIGLVSCGTTNIKPQNTKGDEFELPKKFDAKGGSNYCVIGYTVTKQGTTKDHVVLDCPGKQFIDAALEAAKKFTYKPRVVDGEAVEVKNVRNKFTFELAE